MILNLTNVLTSEGAKEQHKAELSLDSFSCRQGVYPIVDKSPILIWLENAGERKAKLEAETSVTLAIPCDRCLKDVDTKLILKIKRDIDMTEETDEEAVLEREQMVEGQDLLVDNLIYHEILINLPMKILCREDCKGICRKCGQNLNEGSCGCDTTELDPRMAAIKDIFQGYKEV